MKKPTYQEYLDMPEMRARYDIIDGEMIMSAKPTLLHQTISKLLFMGIYPFVTEHKLGQVLFAPLDIIVREEPLRTRQPDVMFVSNENRGILRDFVHGGPDLVADILSPSNDRKNIEGKLADYAGLGVRECWLVSPQGQTVEVLVLEQGDWRRLAILGMGDNVKSAVLIGLALPVDEIFGQT
jgi:Uma2 family endonuclease